MPLVCMQFAWSKPDATSQWLLQKFIGLTSEQGAWPLIYSALAPEDQLQGAETGRLHPLRSQATRAPTIFLSCRLELSV